MWVQAYRHPRVARDRVELEARWRDLVAHVVSDGTATGEIGPVDVRGFAVAWCALLDGLSIQVALSDPEVDPDRAFTIAMDFASRYLAL